MEDDTIIGNFCLFKISFEHWAGAAIDFFEEIIQVFEDIGVNDQFPTEIIAQEWFGNIVCCWTETTGDDDDACVLSFFIESLSNVIGNISNSNSTTNPYADFVEFLGDESAVGIDCLADE